MRDKKKEQQPILLRNPPITHAFPLDDKNNIINNLHISWSNALSLMQAYVCGINFTIEHFTIREILFNNGYKNSPLLFPKLAFSIINIIIRCIQTLEGITIRQ